MMTLVYFRHILENDAGLLWAAPFGPRHSYAPIIAIHLRAINVQCIEWAT
jgi:hypothetical protein